VREKLERMDLGRLARECAKLNRAFNRVWRTRGAGRPLRNGSNSEGAPRRVARLR